MIDFTDLPHKNKSYSGKNSNKIAVVYNDELYMLKFPILMAQNTDISYIHKCVSEYIGCKIFKSVGIPTQEVALGTYTTPKGKNKLAVACKDFAINGLIVETFAMYKNQFVDLGKNGFEMELNDILSVFSVQTAIDKNLLIERFWDMFIVDALIGNWNRNNENWGFLYNGRTDELSLAPVYSCGNSLFSKSDETLIREVLYDNRTFNCPISVITQDFQKINHYTFISSKQNDDCNKALFRILNKLDMDKINSIIDETPVISDEHKLFLKTVLFTRKEQLFACL